MCVGDRLCLRLGYAPRLPKSGPEGTPSAEAAATSNCIRDQHRIKPKLKTANESKGSSSFVHSGRSSHTPKSP
eukprot:6201712-Pleurochrysis_carterae.AAC.1